MEEGDSRRRFLEAALFSNFLAQSTPAFMSHSPFSHGASGQKILEVEGLHVRYVQVHAVLGLDLELYAGQTLALLGPNGSGKSSTLSAITGLVPAHAGRIRIGGIDLAVDPHACRARLGVVPQEFAFYEEMSVQENLLFAGRLYNLHGSKLRSRVGEALEFVSLGDVAKRKAGQLSGGMQRRLNLACALLHHPALLLLDEPTVGLDIASRDTIYRLLESLASQGTAIVLTTHHLHEAESFCERIALMSKGTIVAQGTLDELRRLSQKAPSTDPAFSDSADSFAHANAGHRLRGPRSVENGLERIYTRLLAATPVSPSSSSSASSFTPGERR